MHVTFNSLFDTPDLVVSYISNYDFYCKLPSLSRLHQSIMRTESIHRSQWRTRLPMTVLQQELFANERFDALYVPLDNISTIEELRAKILPTQVRSAQSTDKLVSQPKIWWLECTRLYLHLAFAARFLTREAPTHIYHFETQQNVKISYVLPRVVQHVLIDELTSFFVYNLLRRYAVKGLYKSYLFENIHYSVDHLESIRETKLFWDHCDDDHPTLELMSRARHSFQIDEQTPNEVVLDRLGARGGEAIYLGQSRARGCGDSFHHLAWITPPLLDAFDKLDEMSTPPSVVTVDLDSAVPIQWNTSNGDIVPYILQPDTLIDWVFYGGMSERLTQREHFRLARFVYGNEAVSKYEPCSGTRILDETAREELLSYLAYIDFDPSESDVDFRGRYETSIYGVIGQYVERYSSWWQKEQQQWLDAHIEPIAQIRTYFGTHKENASHQSKATFDYFLRYTADGLQSEEDDE